MRLELDKKRNKILDAMKGILIILVVLGHIIVDIYAPENYSNNILFKICYSFHMPAFIMISGYLVGKKDVNYIKGKWIKKRFLSLGIPYLIWLLINILVYNQKISLLIYFKQICGGGKIWFLRCLLIADLSVYLSVNISARIIKNISDKLTYSFVIIGGVFISLSFSVIHFIDNTKFSNEASFLPFYFLGFALAVRIKIIETIKKYKEIILDLCCILYPISMVIYQYASENRLIMINRLVGNAPRTLYTIIFLLYTVHCKFIVPILGTGCLYRVLSLKKIQDLTIYNLIAKLGQYTLQIYLLSGFLYFTLLENRIIDSFLSMVTCVMGSILISIIIKTKLPYLNKLLFGR
ncbi:MAG: acyltransferase family protein [Clostridiales bacterium]|nr:acyltransferase family protein [Clostridiales bacterium]